MAKRERFLVTSALPYANGPLHFGHLVGAYLPADLFVRFQRMRGNDVLFLCGTDEHGVAITLQAEAEKKSYASFVDAWHERIRGTFEVFRIEFDHFSRTSRPIHHKLAQEFFTELHRNGHISEKEEDQLYCTKCKRFLADRYVEGDCPYCGSTGARGDECGKCGRWLESGRIRNPRCKTCGATPETRRSKNWYLRLQDFQPRLEEWIRSRQGWKENVLGFVNSLLKEGLRERPITRDLPWGVPVPLPEAKGKVLYVWFDAPIGYVSATQEWAGKSGEPERWKEYWQNPETKIVHFIGKDNIPFHCLVFPAMLLGQTSKYNLPHQVPANEFFNLEGRKFSTSNRWTIDLDYATSKYSVDTLRFALASNLPEMGDSEFTWKDFYARANHELADVLGNLATRVLLFAERSFENRVPEGSRVMAKETEVLARLKEVPRAYAQAMDQFQFRRAVGEMMGLARLGNRYFDEKSPWARVKEDPKDAATTINISLQLLRTLSFLMAPIMPDAAEKLWKMLGQKGEVRKQPWDEAGTKLLEVGHPLGKGEALFPKLDMKGLEMELENLHKSASEGAKATQQPSPVKTEIEYDDFGKLDLRVGKILKAERVQNADRLLHVSVDIGSDVRQIVAGIANSYEPEALVGKDVVVLANLKPKKLRGFVSQGMILAAVDGERSRLLRPDGEPPAGAIVK